MEENNRSWISSSELTTMIVGSVIGLGILSLPAALTKIASNSGWIAIIVGTIEPTFVILMASYFASKYPRDNIYDLNKKMFGKFFGNIMSIIFASQFFIHLIFTGAGLGNVLRVYFFLILKQYKMMLPILVVGIYAATKGIKALARLNEITFYITIPLVIITIFSARQGDISNLLPIIPQNMLNVLRASKECVFSYVGIETIFLIYPYLDKKGSVKKASLKGILITFIIYMWFGVLTILYLGPDVTSTLLWPSIALTENVSVPGISNFKYIFLFLWSIIVFKTISNQFFFLYKSYSYIFNKKNINTFLVVILPIVLYLQTKLENPYVLQEIINVVSTIYTLFNLILVILLGIKIKMKKGEKDDN